VTWVAVAALVALAAAPAAAIRLEVPAVRQAPERCGPAALAMVLDYYRAGSAQVAEADRAYDPALRGALITDLAHAAERAGFAARVEEPGEDSLRALLRAGVPPLLLYDRGLGPLHKGHYGVLVGWDPARERYMLNDGGGRPREMGRAELMRRWKSAGAQALIVRRP
jgi:ABC-type bacteriocin/lantibiotic exporter with double-glycine peptidase domain